MNQHSIMLLDLQLIRRGNSRARGGGGQVSAEGAATSVGRAECEIRDTSGRDHVLNVNGV